MAGIEPFPEIRYRFVVARDDGEVLFDRVVHYREADATGTEQSRVAMAAVDAGHTVTLSMLDPDEHDQVLFRAVWSP